MMLRNTHARVDKLEKVSPEKQPPICIKVMENEKGHFVQLPNNDTTKPIKAKNIQDFEKQLKLKYGKDYYLVIIKVPEQLPEIDSDGIPPGYGKPKP